MTRPAQAFAAGSFAPMLRTLSGLLDKAAAQVSDPDALTKARLAPDMYDLGQQVQQACGYALDATARLTGQATPEVMTGLDRLEALKDHIARTLSHLDGVAEAAFDGAETRRIVMPLGPELVLEADGLAFLRDWSLPHFYFHVVTAYDILRHQGVVIGKRDYLAGVAAHIRPAAALST